MRNTLSKATVAALMLLAVGCGKRGDPRPPVPVIPAATSDLVVTQRADKVILSWSYPALTTAGRSLQKVDRVQVLRYVESLPADATGPGADPLPDSSADPGRPLAVAKFAAVPTISPNQFSRLGEKIDSIDGARLPAATSGTKLVFEDTPPMASSDGRPVRLTYAVVTEGGTTESDLSNLVMIVPLPVPPPPANVTATAAAAGVTVRWSDADGSKAFNVYRTPQGELPDEFATPLNTAPITGTTYTDVPAFGTYDYRVTSVASEGPPRIESGLSTAAATTYKDLVPPSPPASVTALLETKIVRLIWDPVDAPDLQGYNVYRTEGTARLKLTPHPAQQTFFGDESIDIGIAYFYSITAVDKSGNESTPVNSSTVLVPKTP